ncbi:MAG: 4'-phosphopantetheinyl transferase superfamily protein [Chelatococcus sp.]|uniref:4'-phosphopantetheinyl transferase family protein n=1 Tax=unclassified Chelatococcus TaxID=2638111 RepID=UPI001BCC4E5E|nr:MULTISPECIES: 4'-phosphopantetheinyl transferase superfamily protein [unclassified Chelatococcus]CAH1648068.1 4'-phosphopantetheinyl transferase [Hyphomicrobiales bacterium]MBS7742078.1 4'-phosphopantetheinyl transferase superfamily protein [Chelatococcus sp. HY11]MBX3537518.1 4'-phosphopantetheinyl transferase superfamily protein [Chelatococcus sp.]MBX3541124.1 4'-phosphopantetheinyl transferase superfamily protein [Chelatococcus sp.]MCO5074981.1 4'-phosphopantetheinyl transferase superfam
MNEIHADVILASVEANAAKLSALNEVLAPIEVSRAQTFRQLADRQRFVTAHGLLRAVLGIKLRCRPAAVPLIRKTSGQWACEGHDIHVSLSHSGSYVAVATADCPVGIDIEEVAGTDALALAREWFSPTEAAAVEDASPAAQNMVFFGYWTAKEAVLKAAGAGLSVALMDFSVAPPEANPRPVTLLKPLPALVGLAVARLPAPEGYAAALSLPDGVWTISQRYESASKALAHSIDAFR